ncbi:MAG TPA: carbon-nitrogen hydrolase family protein [Limnochordia bacterium]|nr:carbon-nitrogen hydrolase family protein [Limnochordia bacterium]
MNPIELKAWAPRPALAPVIEGDLQTGLRAASNGSRGCYGGWELVYEAIPEGTHAQFAIEARIAGLEDGLESISVEAKWAGEHGQTLDWSPIYERTDGVDGWFTLSGRIANTSGARRLVVKLLLRWSATGTVEWRNPRLTPADPPTKRPIRLGAGSSQLGSGERTLVANRDRFVALCRRAAQEGVQLFCLPEVILSWGLPRGAEQLMDVAVEVPGEHIAPFQQVAAEFGMAICFSVHEREDDLVYNTAVLIDEQGRLAGKYRKVHLAPPEEMWQGVTPGRTFDVVRIGPGAANVGMNICMDSSVPEAARESARLGAEVLLLPIMGDHRADRWTRGRPQFDIERWMLIQRMRAMDNHVFLVAARNNGVGTGIFAPDGSILAMDGGDRSIVWADVDLSEHKQSWTGATFKDICWTERRPAVYGR